MLFVSILIGHQVRWTVLFLFGIPPTRVRLNTQLTRRILVLVTLIVSSKLPLPLFSLLFFDMLYRGQLANKLPQRLSFYFFVPGTFLRPWIQYLSVNHRGGFVTYLLYDNLFALVNLLSVHLWTGRPPQRVGYIFYNNLLALVYIV